MRFEHPEVAELGRSAAAMRLKRIAKTLDGSIVAMSRALGLGVRRSVLFEAYNTIGFDAQEPVIEALLQRDRVVVYMSAATERRIPVSRLERLERLGARRLSIMAVRHRRFDAAVITDGQLVTSWRTSRYVYLNHGSGFGNRATPYALELLTQGEANYFLSGHPSATAVIASALGREMNDRVRAIGMPKLDRLMQDRPRREAVLDSLHLDPARPTLLVLSHWTPESLMHSIGDHVLGVLREYRDCNVIVTGHAHLWDHPDRSGGVDWRARLAWIAHEPHMRLAPKPDDLTALMVAADLAVTDHTSATLEFALLRRPIVLYRNPAFPFSGSSDDELLRATCHVFSEANGFREALDCARRTPAIDPSAREALLAHTFINLGCSANAAARALEDLAIGGAFRGEYLCDGDDATVPMDR